MLTLLLTNVLSSVKRNDQNDDHTKNDTKKTKENFPVTQLSLISLLFITKIARLESILFYSAWAGNWASTKVG